MKNIIKPDLSEKQEVLWARGASLGALLIGVYFGINPPADFVAQTVAFAFGLAASSFFPTLLLGIFSKRVNRAGGISGMITGIAFTLGYIIYFQFGFFGLKGTPEQYFLNISPAGIGAIGMVINFIVTGIVTVLTPAPPKEIQEMVADIRLPHGAGDAVDH